MAPTIFKFRSQEPQILVFYFILFSFSIPSCNAREPSDIACANLTCLRKLSVNNHDDVFYFLLNIFSLLYNGRIFNLPASVWHI